MTPPGTLGERKVNLSGSPPGAGPGGSYSRQRCGRCPHRPDRGRGPASRRRRRAVEARGAFSRGWEEAGARLGLAAGEARRHPAAVVAALGQREAAAARRRRDGERLQGALDAAGLGVLITDPGGAVVLANQAALPYLSGRPGEAVLEGQVSEAIAAALTAGRALNRETRALHPAPAGGAARGDAARCRRRGASGGRGLCGRHHRGASRGGDAARLRGQRGPRAQDAAGGPRGAGRDPVGQCGRRGCGGTPRRAVAGRGAAAVAVARRHARSLSGRSRRQLPACRCRSPRWWPRWRDRLGRRRLGRAWTWSWGRSPRAR